MESEKCNDKDGRLLATTLDDGQACGVGLGLRPGAEMVKKFFLFFLVLSAIRQRFGTGSATIRL